MKTKISITLNQKIVDEIDSIIDNIYIRNRSQAIEHLVRNALGENKTAVILAGGDENNLKIAENEYRMTIRINNKTLIEKSVKKLRDNNFKRIYLIARHNVLTKIFEILKEGTSYGVKISYIEEKNSSGTADSLRFVKGLITTNFLVVYGDIIFDKINVEELWNDHIKHNAVTTIMLTTSSQPT